MLLMPAMSGLWAQGVRVVDHVAQSALPSPCPDHEH